jgi:putative FmdB family regulatory protein
MPIHEYACRGCGQEFETLVRSSEIPSCTSCGSTALDKKLSVFATQGEKALPACGTCGDPRGPGACKLN